MVGILTLMDTLLRNFRLAEEHWNICAKNALRSLQTHWGIFGSLKSTETERHNNKNNRNCALRNFRLAEEHWNARWWCWSYWSRCIEEFSARWRALKPICIKNSCAFTAHWGIFGSLKSTETFMSVDPFFANIALRNFRLAEEHWNTDIRFCRCSGFILRNFRLAEEHWNLIVMDLRDDWVRLRNFRLAEEHWNEVCGATNNLGYLIEEFSARWRALKLQWQNWATICIEIEEFSARWRALKHRRMSKKMLLSGQLRNFRLAEEHWNLDGWGTGAHGYWIEEFSARWRALKLGLIPKSPKNTAIEEFSARWRALKLVCVTVSTSWGWIEEFSARWRALKRYINYCCVRSIHNWGIFGSLKSTETMSCWKKRCDVYSIEEFSARWRALKLIIEFGIPET